MINPREAIDKGENQLLQIFGIILIIFLVWLCITQYIKINKLEYRLSFSDPQKIEQRVKQLYERMEVLEAL